MSAPVFLAADVSGDRVVLDGPEGRHAASVRRLQVGEPVDVVDGRGTRASCAVASVARDRVELTVLGHVLEPAPALRIVLVQGLPKGDRGELAVELATEVGVDEVVPWAASRCVMQWKGERGVKQLARWRSTAREAGKQSRRSWTPAVDEVRTTRQLADRLDGATVLVLHEQATVRLAEVALPVEGLVALVVGPEGGITADELEALGGTAVRLGTSVLRTSTAGAAAVAVISARTGRW